MGTPVKLPEASAVYNKADQDRTRKQIEQAIRDTSVALTGGALAVLLAGAPVSSAINALNFTNSFTVTETPSGQANVGIASPISRSLLPVQIAYEDEANTFNLTQTFSGLVSITGGKLLIDGTDSVIAAGENGIAENGGNLRLGTRNSMVFDIDNDNNATGIQFIWSQHALASTIMTLTDDGSLNLQGGLFKTAPVGAGFYVTMVGDAGVADRGGLLLNNSTGAARHWKQTATFTGAPGTSSRYRAGWVANADLETFIGGAAIEVSPTNTVQLTGALLWATDNSVDVGASGATRPRTGYFGTSIVTPAVYSAAAQALNLGDALTSRWQIAVGGHLIAITDATNDIGTAANRPRNIYISNQFGIGSTPPNGTVDITVGRAGRNDGRLYNSSNAVDERVTDLWSLDGAGGALSLSLGITRADAGTAGHQGLKFVRSGNTWTVANLMFSGGTVQIGSAAAAMLVSILGSGGTTLTMEGAAATTRDIIFRTTGALNRWVMRCNASAETGGNAGSDFQLLARDDAGALIDSPITVIRAAGGAITLSRPTSISAALTISAGGIDVTGDITARGRLVFTTAAAKIVPGATSISHRNNADNADNLLLLDNGAASFRNNVTITTAGATDGLAISRPTATVAGINFQTAGSNRWGIYVTEAAESGSDAGSNFRIRARSDAGAFLDDPITIVRAATGAIALGNSGTRAVVIGVDPGGAQILRVGGSEQLNGSLVILPAASKIIPGATSLSLRNNADGADNILISDAGAITFRGALSGATTLSLAGPITLTTAASKIIPGATSLALRNNADNANNLLLTDAGVATFRNDVVMDVLGTFDHTGTRFAASGTGPVGYDIMSFDPAVSKWRPRFFQASVGTGILNAAASNAGDGTFGVYAFSVVYDNATHAVPSVPVVTPIYGGFIIDMGALPPSGASYVLDYAHDAGAYTSGALIFTSRYLVYQFFANNGALPFGTTASPFTFKAKSRGKADGTQDSAYSAASASATVSLSQEVNAFGLVVASQIACVNLAAISSDLGVVAAGTIADTTVVASQTRGIFIKSSAFQTAPGTNWTQGIVLADGVTIPAATLYLINFGNNTIPTTTRVVLDMFGGLFTVRDNQATPKTRVKIGKIAGGTTDYGLQVFDTAGSTIVDMTAANLLIQDAAVKFKADFTNALITVTDNQGSPIVRSKYGKVGAGTTDYGIQIFDKDAATILDMTGAKRILAVPVQPSTDSGTAITVDLSTGLTQQVRLTGTATVTFTNPTNGGRYRVWFQQDATGSRPFPTLKGPNGEVFMYTNDTAPTLTTTPGALDLFEFEYRTSPTTRFTVMTLQTNVLLPTPTLASGTNPAVTSVSVASTTHNINITTAATTGDLLLMFVAWTTAPGTVTTPTGWTTQGNNGNISIFSKTSDGTEGGTTVNVATTNSVKAAGQVYRITGTKWFGNAATGVNTATSSGAPGTSADPPNNAPSWTDDRTLWFAAMSVTGAPTITDPANYGNPNETADGAATSKLRTVRRVKYGASEDPAAFTWTGSQTWNAATVAVRPPA